MQKRKYDRRKRIVLLLIAVLFVLLIVVIVWELLPRDVPDSAEWQSSESIEPIEVDDGGPDGRNEVSEMQTDSGVETRSNVTSARKSDLIVFVVDLDACFQRFFEIPRNLKIVAETQEKYDQMFQDSATEEERDRIRNEHAMELESIRADALAELREIIKRFAERRSATIVLHPKDMTKSEAPTVIYFSPKLDITSSILEEIDQIASNK